MGSSSEGRQLVSRLHELDQRLHTLSEISNIMRSMKVLSLMETRKLSRFLDCQQQVVSTIETVASDFSHYYALAEHGTERIVHMYLLLGSERGFCGDFNDALAHAMEQEISTQESDNIGIIGVGRKLRSKLENDPRIVALMDGPVVAEEVHLCLDRLVDQLFDWQNRHGPFSLTVLHHDIDKERATARQILPPFRDLPARPHDSAHPPVLNLAPQDFLSDLIDHYLFAVLNEVFFTSLMAENHRRVHHLEGALDRLEKQVDALTLRRNSQRQEEITEEIEIIMLSTQDVGANTLDKASLTRMPKTR
jgi:F-type H+-transporting ATPase subunit gamma